MPRAGLGRGRTVLKHATHSALTSCNQNKNTEIVMYLARGREGSGDAAEACGGRVRRAAAVPAVKGYYDAVESRRS